MLVGVRMTYPVITVGSRATIENVLEKMKQECIHSLPVVDRQGRLLGLLEKEHIDAKLETLAGSFDEIVAEDLMNKKVLTVTENTPIEEAARMIADYDTKSLPVLRGNFVVGIITSTSLIRILLELTGAREDGVRITFAMERTPGNMLPVLENIMQKGGTVSVFSSYYCEDKSQQIMTLKVKGIEKYDLKQIILPDVTKIIDIR